MARGRIIPRDLHLFTSAQLQPLESALPARWPDSWCDLARIFFIGMLNAPGAFADPKEMAKVAMEQVRVAARQIGGRNTYIPTCVRVELEERDEGVRAEFDGTNYQELAAKHGLTESRIRQIVDEALCNKARGARR